MTGTTYYVSNGGNDQNDGLTPETAWATLARVSEAELCPGDAVRFRRGDLFRGLVQTKPGVGYGAYGEGEKPRIYGWDIEPSMRKPSPSTVLEVMRDYNLSPDEVLVVDDLKPGYDMARGAGVVFAAAGWAYDVPEIEEFMRKNCDYYLKTTDELYKLLFD